MVKERIGNALYWFRDDDIRERALRLYACRSMPMTYREALCDSSLTQMAEVVIDMERQVLIKCRPVLLEDLIDHYLEVGPSEQYRATAQLSG